MGILERCGNRRAIAGPPGDRLAKFGKKAAKSETGSTDPISEDSRFG
jgi:hypothetical protein